MTDIITYDRIVAWEEDLRELSEEIAGPLFTRPEPRATFADLVRGLLADVARKNSWQLADHVGHGTAYRIEWLLNGAKWDADALRDRVRDYVVAGLRPEAAGGGPAVLVGDDTAVIKKGDRSVGVAYQHCGLTGQVENCQVICMLTYAGERGHAFIDRELYLPQGWAADAGRRARAGVPADRTFATKPQLMALMLERQLAAGVGLDYFAADAGYGRDPGLREFCHRREVAYVLAVPVDLPLVGVRGQSECAGHVLDRLLALGEGSVWERRSCGAGTKGARVYDWTAIAVTVTDQAPAAGFTHTLLLRRSTSNPAEVEFFLAHAPTGTAIPELISVAGMRWKIEENNESGKDLLGLDEYQVRKWTPFHRHVTTTMFALAWLAVTRARLGKDPRTKERSS
jgi:SRSO17 transposase